MTKLNGTHIQMQCSENMYICIEQFSGGGKERETNKFPWFSILAIIPVACNRLYIFRP